MNILNIKTRISKCNDIAVICLHSVILFGIVIANRYSYKLTVTNIDHYIDRKSYIYMANKIADANGFGWVKQKGLFRVVDRIQ